MAVSIGTLCDRLLTGLLGDAEHAEDARPRLMLDMLSDWLPYRVYDPQSRLYVNARSKGFVLAVTPLIGADERTGEILGCRFPLRSDPVFPSRIDPGDGMSRRAGFGSSW